MRWKADVKITAFRLESADHSGERIKVLERISQVAAEERSSFYVEERRVRSVDGADGSHHLSEKKASEQLSETFFKARIHVGGKEISFEEKKIYPQGNWVANISEVAMKPGALLIDILTLKKRVIKALQDGLKVFPRDPQIHSELGVALLSVGEAKKAGEHFERAFELKPQDQDFSNRYADFINIVEKNPKKALNILDITSALIRDASKMPRV